MLKTSPRNKSVAWKHGWQDSSTTLDLTTVDGRRGTREKGDYHDDREGAEPHTFKPNKHIQKVVHVRNEYMQGILKKEFKRPGNQTGV